MKETYNVAVLMDDGTKSNLLKSIFTLTEKRSPRYVREDNIQNFGYLNIDICIIDPSSIASIKLFLKILKYHNTVKGLFLLGQGLPLTTISERLNTLKYEEKYSNLIEIFQQEIKSIPTVAHPFSWVKVVNALDLVAKSISKNEDGTKSTDEYSSALAGDSQSGGDYVPNPDNYLDNANFERHATDKNTQEAEGLPSSLSSISSLSDNDANSPAVPSSKLDLRALVVDDSQQARQYVSDKLKTDDIKVDFAIDGQEALIMLGQKKYDIIFLDVMMPGVDGYQICKHIKNETSLMGLRCMVVMLTSKGGVFDKLRGTLSGCDAYLTKPVSDNDLFQIVDKAKRIKRG